MKYAIIVNPVSGKKSKDEKKQMLENVKQVLGNDCEIQGLDTNSKSEFEKCAQDLAQKTEVLIAAGGDGTLSNVINAVGDKVIFSYLPLGSGNAMRSYLGMPRDMDGIALAIKNGKDHAVDMVLCNDNKSFFASIGIERLLIQEREKIQNKGVRGFTAYSAAAIKSAIEYKPREMIIKIDNEKTIKRKVVTAMITKTQYYGYNLKINPRARKDDWLLHMLIIDSYPRMAFGIATSFVDGNKEGEYITAKNLKIQCENDVFLQTDGELIEKGKEFEFNILPKCIRMRY